MSVQKIRQIIDESIDCGEISQQEHDRIMRAIHADGQIDAAEKEQLSRLFSALSSGRITLVDDERTAFNRNSKSARMFSEFTQDAVSRDAQRTEVKLAKPAIEDKLTADNLSSENNSATETNNKKVNPEIANAEPIGEGSSPDALADYDLGSFVLQAQKRRTGGPVFELVNERMLDVNLNGLVWTKAGAMVGYYGVVKFTREGIFEHGLGKTLKKAATGEGTDLTKATGQGTLYLADQGKKISIFNIRGHSLVVNGSNLLAFEEGVKWDITFLKQFAGVWSGGFFNVRLSGNGMAAISSHFDPVVLQVKPGEPVMTDMQATVAWSGGLAPQFKTDIAANTLIGRSSGDTIQMRFEGDGFVIIQPFEEPPQAKS